MKDLYNKTFDQVRMPDSRVDELGKMLASRCEKKEAIMKNRNGMMRRPVALIAAVVLMLALSLTAFAFGEEILRVYRLMSGGVVEQAENYTAVSADTEQTVSPVEEREGRLWLVVNGENKNITGLCSDTEPYVYTCTGEDGLQHIFIIGGDLGAVGWAEFILDENGTYMGGMADFGNAMGMEDLLWMKKAAREIGLPWYVYEE